MATDENKQPVPRKTSEYHAQVLNSLTSGVLVLDAEGRIIEHNEAAGRQLGVAPGVLREGSPARELPGKLGLDAIFEELARSGRPILRRELQLGSGLQARVVGLSAYPLQGEAAFNGAILLFADLSEVRRLEQEARINRQLAEIGELTAGVVHELRNPIGIISMLGELLQRNSPADSQSSHWAQSILRETEGLRLLVDRFLSFAKPFEPRKARCDASEIVERAVQLCRKVLDDRQVPLSVDWKVSPPQLLADAGLLTQALSNLVRNAAELSEEGKPIEVIVDTADGMWIVEVHDRGPGVKAVLSDPNDLFRPFMSKRPGGTGLGLSIAHRAVTAHGGTITWRNRVDGGAAFRMEVPLPTDAA